MARSNRPSTASARQPPQRSLPGTRASTCGRAAVRRDARAAARRRSLVLSRDSHLRLYRRTRRLVPLRNPLVVGGVEGCKLGDVPEEALRETAVEFRGDVAASAATDSAASATPPQATDAPAPSAGSLCWCQWRPTGGRSTPAPGHGVSTVAVRGGRQSRERLGAPGPSGRRCPASGRLRTGRRGGQRRMRSGERPRSSGAPR